MNNPETFQSDPQHASGMPTGTLPAPGTDTNLASGTMDSPHIDHTSNQDTSNQDTSNQDMAAGSVKEAVRDEVAKAKSIASTQVNQTVTQVRSEADRAKQLAQAKIDEAKQRTKSAAQRVVENKKSQLSGQLGLVTEALSRTSQKLHEDQHDSIAQYTDLAANKLEAFRHTIESKDINELIDDAQSFARRQPGLVFGGMFLAGLAAMRFMKASSHDLTQREIERRQATGDVDLSDRYGRTLTPQQAEVVTRKPSHPPTF